MKAKGRHSLATRLPEKYCTYRVSEPFINGNGYKHIYVPEHPLALKSGSISIHWLIAWAVTNGKFNPKKGHQVHHIDSDILNNNNDNLIICNSHSYHKLLHVRTNAYYSCGSANFRKCHICKKWDDPDKMYIGGNNGYIAYHRECYNKWHKENRIKRGKD